MPFIVEEHCLGVVESASIAGNYATNEIVKRIRTVQLEEKLIDIGTDEASNLYVVGDWLEGQLSSPLFNSSFETAWFAQQASFCCGNGMKCHPLIKKGIVKSGHHDTKSIR